MSSDTFIHDFERTDNSDALHAILGRALIIATRFDAMCQAAAHALDIKKRAILGSCIANDEDRTLLSEIAQTYRTLNSSIRAIGLPEDISVILNDAKAARNAVVHDLAKGLTGCLDTKADEFSLIREVSELIFDLAHGDVVISLTISIFNGAALPNTEFRSSYKERMIRWVVEK